MATVSLRKLAMERMAQSAETKNLIWQLNQHSEKCNCQLCGPARRELIKRGVSVTKPKITKAS